MDTNDRTLALSVLRDTLTTGKPADRVRAAQLLLEHDAPGARQADALALSDDELLQIARGVHPRERGPAVPAAESVPSNARSEHPEKRDPLGDPRIPDRGAGDPKENPQIAIRPPGLVTPKGGPKEDPQIGIAPGGSIWGPIAKKNPPVASQIEIDNTVSAPEPWE